MDKRRKITSVASSVQLDTSFVNMLITSGSKFVIIISNVWSDSLIDFGLSKVNKYLIEKKTKLFLKTVIEEFYFSI
jgi:hypothetical protein